jgi:hypothetical protein
VIIHPDLAPHQRKAIGEMHDGCILWGGVGSGKSRAGLAYYAMTEQHEDLYVITTAKKRDSLDWKEEAMHFGIGDQPDTTLHGILNVDSWNNIEKYVDVKGAFFIFDEQRLVGSGKWSKSFLKIARNNRWIMLSATPGDTWLDYIPVFIANGYYRNRTEFKRQHVVYNTYAKFPKVDRYVEVGKLVRLRNQILVHMPYTRQTTRHLVPVWCEFDQAMLDVAFKERWNPFKDEPIRDVAELMHVMRVIVNMHPSRVENLGQLVAKHPRLITFYNFDFELRLLREFGDTLDAPVAEWNGHFHQDIPEADSWLYLVQYAAGAEGWNCISTDATAFYSLPYSYKLWEQAHGRIDRLNTPFTDLWYYALRSKAGIDMSIMRSLKGKESFQFNHFGMSDQEFVEHRVKTAA